VRIVLSAVALAKVDLSASFQRIRRYPTQGDTRRHKATQGDTAGAPDSNPAFGTAHNERTRVSPSLEFRLQAAFGTSAGLQQGIRDSRK